MKREAGAFVLALALAASARAAPDGSVASVQTREGRVEIRLGRVPAGAREWEAFLSLDGGRSFPLRITPHLGTAVDFFSWSIPGLLGDDARIRLRFGDEREESQFDLPDSFRLAPTLAATLALPKVGDIGKKPFPGEEGLAGWVEGTPDGENLRFVAPPPLRGLDSAVGRGCGFRQEACFERRGLEAPSPKPPVRRNSAADRHPTPAGNRTPGIASALKQSPRLNI